MAKWSGVYLEDCHKLLKKIEKELEKVVKELNMLHEILEGERGKLDFALELQDKIKKWRKEMYNE